MNAFLTKQVRLFLQDSHFKCLRKYRRPLSINIHKSRFVIVLFLRDKKDKSPDSRQNHQRCPVVEKSWTGRRNDMIKCEDSNDNNGDHNGHNPRLSEELACQCIQIHPRDHKSSLLRERETNRWKPSDHAKDTTGRTKDKKQNQKQSSSEFHENFLRVVTCLEWWELRLETAVHWLWESTTGSSKRLSWLS